MSSYDNWSPTGPPSTWRKQFQEHDYAVSISNNIQRVPIRRRTAVEILDDAANFLEKRFDNVGLSYTAAPSGESGKAQPSCKADEFGQSG